MTAVEHDERPWGNYTVLSDEDDHKVKRIVVHPGKRLSYQTMLAERSTGTSSVESRP